jgi:hypothetical protein
VNFKQVADGVRFNLYAEANEMSWVGVGLSLDGGRSMGNDAVVACYENTVANYWNIVLPNFYSLPLEVHTGCPITHWIHCKKIR